MACLNMYNNEQQSFCTGPRISFSNDFADTKQSINHENMSYREAPVSSDFEFSVSGNSLISADEVFSNGKLVPVIKEKYSSTTAKVVTLRDELLAGGDQDDHDCDDQDHQDIFHYRLPKNSCWWKEKFGLKRNQNGSKKADHHHHQKNFGGLETIDEAARKPVFANEIFTSYMAGAN